jgi:riboflavin biosynthesis pyrimidine reductase
MLEARASTQAWAPTGPCSERSAALSGLYQPLLDAHAKKSAPPWVMAQLGQSLDGFVATATGDSYYVNGAHGLLHLHRLRALCDAVLVGAGTVAIDNPQLTTRRVPGPQPVRVVIDPAARLDGRSRVFRDGQAPSLWVCDARHAAAARARLAEGGAGGPHPAEVLAVVDLFDDEGSGLRAYRPGRAVAALAQRGLRVLFVEGGGMTVSRFFAAGALDRLHLVVAPVLIGNGRRGLQVPAHDVMADCSRPAARTLALGEDMLWDLDLA